MYITTMAVIVAIIFIFITLFSISVGYRIFKKNYQKYGQIGSRSFLVLITLGTSQIGFVLLAIILSLVSIIDFAWVVLDAYAAIFIVIFLSITFNLFKRHLLRSSSNYSVPTLIVKTYSTPFYQKIIIFFGLVTTIPAVVAYYMFSDISTQLAIKIGNTTMIEMNPYLDRSYKDRSYIDMAKAHNDITICDNIKNSNIVKICRESVETLVLERIYKEKIISTKKEDVINCVEIKSEFSKNSIEPNVFDEVVCEQLSLLQEAVTKNDPLICDEILSPFGYPDVSLEDHNDLHVNATEKHASCIVHFIDSPSWQQGCEKLYAFSMFRYNNLAMCDPYNKIVSERTPYFWFQ